jgi:hypothetical protein
VDVYTLSLQVKAGKPSRKRFNSLDELFPNRLRAHKITFEEAKEVASHYKNTNKIPERIKKVL